MKPSNLLLTGLFALILLVTIGSNLVLKAEYDNLDKADPLVSYSKTALPAFHYIKLGGQPFGVTQIQPGKTHQLRIIAEPKYFEWKVDRDTLYFTYLRDWQKNQIQKEFELGATPTFYIIAPDISGIAAHDAIIKVKGWENNDMSFDLSGGAIQFFENTIKNISVRLNADVLTQIAGSNAFGKATFDVKRNSTLQVAKNIFQDFQLEVDSSAQVSLPGGLLNK